MSDTQTTESTQHRANRPPRTTRLLGFGMILLALVQAGAAVRAVTLPADLVAQGIAAQVSLLPALEFLAAAMWTGVFAYYGWMLLQKTGTIKKQARKRSIAMLGAFVVYTVARLAVFAQADYDRNRLPFLLVATVIILFIFTVFYGVRDDAQSQD